LASIRAAAGSLRDPALDWSPDEVRSVAELIDQEAGRLDRLVANLLDLGRIEAGSLTTELRPFSLGDLVRDALEAFESGLEGRPVEVAIPDDLPPVLVDERLASHILGNLVENAIRHTPPGTAIRIAAREAAGEGLVRLVVEDAGPGVPERTLDRLFDKFYRVEPRAPGRRGSGIGLAVVRGFVEALGGRVVARRSELGGLAVVVDLPVAAPPVPTGRAEAVAER
ncbi:MAG TPA: ATP-binding protein, partial [Candidatus Limnocylindrales bacterium]|nr:ATP-binding protein [Candidatus Limnocylindrales bacterium]